MLFAPILSTLACLALTVSARPVARGKDRTKCDCTGTIDGGKPDRNYICRDKRLGPTVLPKKLPLSGFLTTYDRFGDAESPAEFLEKWTDDSGDYVYPPFNGFQLDVNGVPIMGNMTLEFGTFVDRFGSEFGSFISAAAAPYSQRALPPTNLDTNPSAPEFPFNYHVYMVKQPLTVLGGPIAPWFGQPGLGAQFYTGDTGNIMSLIDQGYLEREDPNVLISREQGCA